MFTKEWAEHRSLEPVLFYGTITAFGLAKPFRPRARKGGDTMKNRKRNDKKLFKMNEIFFLLSCHLFAWRCWLSNMYDGGCLLSWILQNEPKHISLAKHTRRNTNPKKNISSTIKQKKDHKVKQKNVNFSLQFL